MQVSISNLQYADPTSTLINMTVSIDGGEAMPFTYSPSDTEAATVAIKALLAGGSYTIAAYAQPAAQINASIDAYCAQRLTSGFADTGAGGTGKTWQCDPVSQGKWTAIGASAGLALVMQASPAPTFTMIAADNSTATLSASDAFALINARMLPWVSETILYARTLKNEVLAGSPPSNIYAGWP